MPLPTLFAKQTAPTGSKRHHINWNLVLGKRKSSVDDDGIGVNKLTKILNPFRMLRAKFQLKQNVLPHMQQCIIRVVSCTFSCCLTVFSIFPFLSWSLDLESAGLSQDLCSVSGSQTKLSCPVVILDREVGSVWYRIWSLLTLWVLTWKHSRSTGSRVWLHKETVLKRITANYRLRTLWSIESEKSLTVFETSQNDSGLNSSIIFIYTTPLPVLVQYNTLILI